MGFRLWVNDDICLGKLYGYTEDSQHLYSIDWLVNHGFFDDEREDWDEKLFPTLYDVAVNSFDCTLGMTISLSYEDFFEYYLLYFADMQKKWRKKGEKVEFKDVEDWTKILGQLPEGKDVKLEWF